MIVILLVVFTIATLSVFIDHPAERIKDIKTACLTKLAPVYFC